MLLRAVAWARSAAIPVFAIVLPGQCSLGARSLEPRDSLPSAVQPKQEPPVARVPSAPPRSPPRRTSVEAITLPEEVVVRAVAAGQPAFLRCWARAQRTDAAQIATKVRMRLEVDATGKVTSISSDTESPTLSRCLAIVARQLPFPSPGRPALVELPLIFR